MVIIAFSYVWRKVRNCRYKNALREINALVILNHKQLKIVEVSSIPFDYRDFQHDLPRFLSCRLFPDPAVLS